MPEESTEETAPIPSKQFSSEDRKIAKLLSPGSDKINSVTDPYQRALLCQLSVRALGQQLNERGVIIDEQEQALEQIGRVYAQRVSASGKSRAQIDQDRAAMQETLPESRELARIGIGCMREFT